MDAMTARFNEALAALAGSRRPPWALIPPGAHVNPWGSASEAASQAPTREATPGPEESRPAAAQEPEQARPAEPEPGPATPAEPERRARKRARAPDADSDSRYPGRRRREQAQPESPGRRRRKQAQPSDTGIRQTRPDKAGITPAATELARRARPPPATAAPGRLGPSAYQAVDARGRFGLVECCRIAVPKGGARPQAAAGHTLVLAHAPPGRDPRALLDLYPGGTIRALRAGGGDWADVRIGFVTRSGYFPPGRPATSVLLGVPGADWARASG